MPRTASVMYGRRVEVHRQQDTRLVTVDDGAQRADGAEEFAAALEMAKRCAGSTLSADLLGAFDRHPVDTPRARSELTRRTILVSDPARPGSEYEQGANTCVARLRR